MKKSLIPTLMTTFAVGLFAASSVKDDPERKLVWDALPSIEKPAKKHHVLCFSKPYGFRHDSIPTGEKMLSAMAEKTEMFEVTFSEDLSNFQPENIKKFDAICFNNNTHIQKGFTEGALRESLINYVKNGGGIFAIHSATDGGWPEYTEMIGGNFDGHPWGAGGTWGIANEDPQHPIVRGVHGGKNFLLKDELYQYKGFDRSSCRVLLAIDMKSPESLTRKGKRADQDYGLAWIKKYGQGRVFVSSLGHNKEVFWNPEILKMWTEGFRFVLGEIDVATESIKKP